MNDCLNHFNYSGHKFHYNNCSNTITAISKINEDLTQDELKSLSTACFDAYKYRLENFSPNMFEIGKQEYDLVNRELISATTIFEPLNYSFSITPDPSLHFFVRFRNKISLFVETFLDIEDGHDTYVQITKSTHNILKVNCVFDDALLQIKDTLENEFSRASFTKQYF